MITYMIWIAALNTILIMNESKEAVNKKPAPYGAGFKFE
jgi:hypothetical protein